MNGEAAIVCQNIGLKIRRKVILNDVNFTIARGQIAGLLGPNGAGKSSLMRILTGMISPTQGEAQVEGKRVGDETRGLTAYLPDRGKLPQSLTVGEWFAFASVLYPDWDAKQAQMMMDVMQVKWDSKMSTLSRGEEARVQLMTCLSRKAPFVILDEPFAGVDLISRERIAQSVVGALADGERTFLIATHDIREMEQLFDRAVFINCGRILGVEDAETLRTRGSSVESHYREVFS